MEGWIKLIAFANSGYYTAFGKFSQTGAKRGGAQAAEFSQFVHGDGLIQTLEDLPDAF
jgi:hypothetical protein